MVKSLHIEQQRLSIYLAMKITLVDEIENCSHISFPAIAFNLPSESRE
jgi:hypothetical protein